MAIKRGLEPSLQLYFLSEIINRKLMAFRKNRVLHLGGVNPYLWM
jgi:hypothetical protein